MQNTVVPLPLRTLPSLPPQTWTPQSPKASTGAFTFLLFLAFSFFFALPLEAPEMSLLVSLKDSPEHRLLSSIQQVTLDLQLLEVALKSHKDAPLEEALAAGLEDVRQQGYVYEQRLKEQRLGQQKELESFLKWSAQFSHYSNLDPEDFRELLASFDPIQGPEERAPFKGGTLGIPIGNNPKKPQEKLLSVLQAQPLRIGQTSLFWFSIPQQSDEAHPSLWNVIRDSRLVKGLKSPSLQPTALQDRLSPLNAFHQRGQGLQTEYFDRSFRRIARVFQNQRYGLLSRLFLIRRQIQDFTKVDQGQTEIPQQLQILYSSLLDHLSRFGVDIAISDQGREFILQGVLLGSSPVEAQLLLQRLQLDKSPFVPQTSAGLDGPSY